MGKIDTTKLKSSDSYRASTANERERICTGCGLSGWKGDLVPETIYGLNISEACNIHDWDYHFGKTIEDKHRADNVFLDNMLILIEQAGGWKKWFRRWRAMTYYSAVRDFGHDAFMSNKKLVK